MILSTLQLRQPVKSRELFKLLSNQYGKNNVNYIETLNWKRHPLRLIYNLKKCCDESNIVIMLPAHNGVNVFSKLLLFFQKTNPLDYITM